MKHSFVHTYTAIYLFAMTLFVSGCGDPLHTEYAPIEGDSVNGCSVLHAVFARDTHLRQARLLSPRLDTHCDLIIHVQSQASVPDAEACTWLHDWLDDGYGRQAVIVLCDGNVAPALCRQWARQADTESAKADGRLREDLKELATRL